MMRADIVPGTAFPHYELSNHAGNAGSFPNCKDKIPKF
jgi:hypothetical protein